MNATGMPKADGKSPIPDTNGTGSDDPGVCRPLAQGARGALDVLDYLVARRASSSFLRHHVAGRAYSGARRLWRDGTRRLLDGDGGYARRDGIRGGDHPVS